MFRNDIISVMCPDSSSNPMSCNRRPFLSDDGCDRGNVDIGRFSELPYCLPFNPTLPDIPPEIVDTPLSLPIPPPCSCFNIDYKLALAYKHEFAASASFVAIGDCCDGNYESRFNLQIPCPVEEPGEKWMRMKIKYGHGDTSYAGKYIDADDSSCTISAHDIDIDLDIPCPVVGNGGNKVGKIYLNLGYDRGVRTEASASFIISDAGKCTIEPLSPRLNLNIPCPLPPVPGDQKNKQGKIRIEASFVPQPKGQIVYSSYSFIDVDVESCTIKVKAANIKIPIPCPVKDKGYKKIKASVTYANSYKYASARYINADRDACSFQVLEPDLKMNIPCPLTRNEPIQLKTKVMYGGRPVSQKIVRLADVDKDRCTITPVSPDLSILNLDIPCPAVASKPIELDASVKYGQGANRKKVHLAEFNRNDCSIIPLQPEMELQLPCPAKSSDPIELGAKIHYGDGANYQKVQLASIDAGTCSIIPLHKELDLSLRCPVVSSKPIELTTSVNWGTGANKKKVTLATFDRGGCTLMPLQPEMELNLQCPKVNFTARSTNDKISVEYNVTNSSDCTSDIDLTIGFSDQSESGGGGGGGGGVNICRDVITDIRYNSAYHRLEIKQARLCFEAGRAVSFDETGWTTMTGGQAVPHTGKC